MLNTYRSVHSRLELSTVVFVSAVVGGAGGEGGRVLGDGDEAEVVLVVDVSCVLAVVDLCRSP